MSEALGSTVEVVRQAVGSVVETAGQGLSNVGSAVGDVAEDGGRRLGLIVGAVVAALALVGLVLWRRANGSSSAEEEAPETQRASA
jgi:hypothetical protein